MIFLPRRVAAVGQGHVADSHLVEDPDHGQVAVDHVAAFEADHDSDLLPPVNVHEICKSGRRINCDHHDKHEELILNAYYG